MSGENGKIGFTLEEILKVTGNLSAIRAIGDLLTAAIDSVNRDRCSLHDQTLEAIGMHLEDLSTEALVILRYEDPQPSPNPQAEAEMAAPEAPASQEAH